MKMVYVLFAAAAAAAIGGVASFSGSAPSSSATMPSPEAPEGTHAEPSEAEAIDPDTAIEGDVLEVIDVPSYTYLRLGAKGTEGTWVAVSTASLKVGDHARVVGATRMPGFTSTTLKRTFAVIYFGELDDGRGVEGVVPPEGDPSPHANRAGSPATSAPDPFSGAADPHASGADAQKGTNGRRTIEVKKVDRASGPNGKTIAEVLRERVALAGKTIRVQATVVKVTSGVLGRTYLHLRDGSGDAAQGTDDLSVTTESTPTVGQVITIEGVVGLDRTIGAGYTFPTLVENAKVL